MDITIDFGEIVWGFESSLSKNSENLICPRGEMDITSDFGSEISSSNLDGGTSLNLFISGRCSDCQNRYIFCFTRTPTRTPYCKIFQCGGSIFDSQF